MAGRAKSKKEKAAPASAYDRAVRLLASRRHTTVELRRKLKQRDYSSAEIEEALARLAELKYVDDAAAAKDWADELARMGGQGRMKAAQKLIARGIAPEVAHRELDWAWDDELERDHAHHSLERLLKVTPTLVETRKGRAKLWRSLMNRGYDAGVVRELLAALPGTADDDPA